MPSPLSLGTKSASSTAAWYNTTGVGKLRCCAYFPCSGHQPVDRLPALLPPPILSARTSVPLNCNICRPGRTHTWSADHRYTLGSPALAGAVRTHNTRCLHSPRFCQLLGCALSHCAHTAGHAQSVLFLEQLLQWWLDVLFSTDEVGSGASFHHDLD